MKKQKCRGKMYGVLVMCFFMTMVLKTSRVYADASHEPPAREKEYVSYTIKMEWEDYENTYRKRPSKVQIILLADGEAMYDVYLSKQNDWQWTYTELDCFRKDGQQISYSVRIDTINQYETWYIPCENGVIIRSSIDPVPYDQTDIFSHRVLTTTLQNIIGNDML